MADPAKLLRMSIMNVFILYCIVIAFLLVYYNI